MYNVKQILLTSALCLLSGAASAVPITGDLLFTGTYTTDTDSATTATVFTFNNPISVGFANQSFAALNGQDITYNVLDLGALPIASLWSAVGSDSVNYKFDLELITKDTVDGNSRTINGIGTITIGADTETYAWAFTSQNPGAGNSPLTFSFSASQAKASEPALALLLGTGLIGLGVARRMRKAS